MHSTHNIMEAMGEPGIRDHLEYRTMGEDLRVAVVFTVGAAIMANTLRLKKTRAKSSSSECTQRSRIVDISMPQCTNHMMDVLHLPALLYLRGISTTAPRAMWTRRSQAYTKE